MDAELARRRALARRAADALSAHAAVSATIVFGSVALGRVDALSDVDVLVVCTEVPTPSERERLVTALGLRYTETPSDSPLFRAQDSGVENDGLVLSLHYQRAAWLAAVIAEVLDGAITNERLPFRPIRSSGCCNAAGSSETKTPS